MNELYNVFFSPKGRIDRSWYIGLSLILLIPFFSISFPLMLQLLGRVSTSLEYGIKLTAIAVSFMTYYSWIIIGIKRIKDQNKSYGRYLFIPLILIDIVIGYYYGVTYFMYATLLLSILTTAIIGILKGSECENDYGLSFRFAFARAGLGRKQKVNTSLVDKVSSHESYLKTNGLKGKKENFSGLDFSNSLFEGKNFSHTDLSNAIFDGADLNGCNFENTNISKASFVGADLSNTNFDKVRGAETARFSRANLENSNLEIDLIKKETLTQIEELAKITKPIFLGLLSACVYSWIAIAGIKDIAIVVDSLEVALPIIQVKIAVSGFFFATPIILYLLFLYFNLYLRRLWLKVGALPFKLQNGEEAIMSAYPWLLLSIGNSNFIEKSNKKDYFKRAEILISFLLIWWAVPFTILVLLLKSLVKHDWWLSTFLILILVMSVVTALIYQINSLILLYRRKRDESASYWEFLSLVFLLILNLFLYAYDGIVGVEIPRYTANIERAFLVEKPPGYFNSTNKDAYKDIIGPDLSNIDLRFANARGVFGVQTLFVGANMEGISLVNAELTKASFENAKLNFSNFGSAELTKASFENAKLNFSNFGSAELTKASFGGAELIKANFENAHLDRTKFKNANLGGVSFRGTNLSSVSFMNADLDSVNFENTNLDSINFKNVNLGGVNFKNANLNGINFKNTNLDDINFENANLSSVSFKNANLGGVNFKNANLDGINFENANLDSVLFNNTNLANVNFKNVKIKKSLFINTNLHDVIFNGILLEENVSINGILDSTLVPSIGWLDSLVVNNSLAREYLMNKYEVDTLERYETWDKKREHPYYLIRKKAN